MPAHDPHESAAPPATPAGTPAPAAQTTSLEPDDRTAPHPSAAGPPLADGLPAVPGYELHNEIARGGMGVVYAATDLGLGRAVAVKALLPELAGRADLIGQFDREARITAQLPHPGIPPVHALGTLPDGRPFLAMKLIQGRTLAAILASRERERPELLPVFEHVCQAVGFAHSEGIIHRDLKPLNVMVGAFGEVQVMDWGLAREAEVRSPESGAREDQNRFAATRSGAIAGEDTDATRVGSAKGTPQYMPPEQAKGEWGEVDARADVFALGGILCAILTGRPPYTGKSGGEVMKKAAAADLADASARLAACGADAELIALAERCLSPAPAARPANGKAVADAVAAYHTGVEDRARKAEAERAAAEAEAREQRKRRKVQLALATAVVVAVGLAAAGLWLNGKRRADQARFEGQQEAERVAREEQTRARVPALERLAKDLRKQLKFAQAARALGEARRLAEDGAPELVGGIDQTRAGLEFARELDDIRYRKYVWGLRPDGTAGLQVKTVVPGYRRAFLARGLDIATGPPEELARHVRASDIRVELLDALDDWAVFESDEEARRSVLAVLRLADPGPWSDRLRDPATRNNPKALVSLAEEVRAGRVPGVRAGAVTALASLMQECQVHPTRLLADALIRNPNDFEIAFKLGAWYQTEYSLRAIGAYQAARTLRPDHLISALNLGVVLARADDPEGAEATLREAVAIDPTHALTRRNFGYALEKRKDFDGAEREYRAAVRLDPADPLNSFYLARVLGLKGDHAQAIAVAREALAARLPYAQDYCDLGIVLYHGGQLDEAAAAFREAIRLDGAHAQAHTSLGSVLLRKGRGAEAVAAHREAIRHKPDLALAHYNLGTALGARGDMPGAAAALRDAVKFDPKNAPALSNLGNALRELKDLTGALAAHQEAVKLAPTDPLCFYQLGVTLKALDRFDEAADAFDGAIRFDPKSAAAYAGLGTVLEFKRDYPRAAVAYQKAIQLDPKDAASHRGLGHVSASRGDWPQAEAALRKATELDPAHAPTHLTLGDVLSERGKPDEAVAAFREAIKRDPKLARAHLNLGVALLGRNDPDGAEKAFRAAVAVKPDYFQAHANLGGVFERRGDPKAAAAAYRDAIKANPKFPIAHYGLGNALAALGDLDGAAAAFRESVKVDPRFAQGYGNLGGVLLEQKKYPEAIAAAREAITVAPNYALPHAVLGYARLESGDRHGAKAAFAEAGRLDPKRFGGLLKQLPPLPVAPPPRAVGP